MRPRRIRKYNRRGFGHYNPYQEHLTVIAIVATAAAVIIPVFNQALVKISKHQHVPAGVNGITVSLVIFVLLPLVLALPVMIGAKMTRRRSDPFREIFFEYWLRAMFGMGYVFFSLVALAIVWTVGAMIVRFFDTLFLPAHGR